MRTGIAKPSSVLRLGLLPGLLLALMSLHAHAHKSSDSFLRLSVTGQVVSGQWDIALRDLEYAIGIDGDGDGAVTWGELRARHAAIADYSLERLTLSADGVVCATRKHEQLVNRKADGSYSVLHFVTTCPDSIEHLEVDYRLFFDLDPLHRGLLHIERNGVSHLAVLSPERATQVFRVADPGTWRQLAGFAREGIWHIWTGYDHILFLICLLLPAALQRDAGAWKARVSFRPVLWQVFTIVTAFTLAHSVTLSLAAFGVLVLPSRFVESAIAASIVLAALNNIYPLVTRRLWGVALVFGLVHGLGFASVLAGLLPSGAPLLTALVGFNAGVEAGQLVIVSAVLPLVFVVRRSPVYRRIALQAGSLAIAMLAAVWFLQRSLDL